MRNAYARLVQQLIFNYRYRAGDFNAHILRPVYIRENSIFDKSKNYARLARELYQTRLLEIRKIAKNDLIKTNRELYAAMCRARNTVFLIAKYLILQPRSGRIMWSLRIFIAAAAARPN